MQLINDGGDLLVDASVFALCGHAIEWSRDETPLEIDQKPSAIQN